MYLGRVGVPKTSRDTKKDCEKPGCPSDHPGQGARPWRRGDRMSATSANGTFRTCRDSLTMSAYRGILLQKSFCITDCKFSGPYVRRSNDHLGLHHTAMNSQATSVTAWRLFRSAISARLVCLREIGRTAFWDVCNTICVTADISVVCV